MKKKLTLGLFGFGCVGQGLYRVLNETQGLDAEIKKICIKHPEKLRSLPAGRFTVSREELLSDPEIDVIVELIDDAETAFEIVEAAVRRGKAVVTANKRMLAERLDEVLALQKKYNRPILYEGAVCGSIPIIRNLEEYYDNDQINRVEGIFNGSTNYILTKVSEEGKSYAEALKEAQVRIGSLIPIALANASGAAFVGHQVGSVPEPATASLLALGLAVFGIGVRPPSNAPPPLKGSL